MTLRARLGQWVFRHGPDTRLPIELTQRRIFILPSGSGLLFAVVLVVMLLGAINYTLSLGHALVFLLAGLGLVGMVHTFRNLVGLSLHPGAPEPVHAGDTAWFPLHCTNTRDEPRPALEIGFAPYPGTKLDATPGLSRVLIPHPAPQRGWLSPGRLTLSTRYPLGLFHAWSYPHPTWRCLVYPRPLERPLPPPTAVDASGERTGEAGQEDFAGLRPRMPSDPPRHVAWKAVARGSDTAPLLVKRFAGGASEELLLDWDALSDVSDDETRLSVLTGWVLAASALHIDFALKLPQQEIAPGHGDAHRDACLRALALYGEDDASATV